MNPFGKLAAVALSASLLLFGCSTGGTGQAGDKTGTGTTVSGFTTANSAEASPVIGEETSEASASMDTTAGESGTVPGDTLTAEESGIVPADTLTPEEIAKMENPDFDTASLSLNDNIHVNQIGYRLKDEKRLTVNGKSVCYAIIDRADGSHVFTGRLEHGKTDIVSGDDLYYADFSGLEKPGTYYAAVAGVGISGDFKIGDNVYDELRNGLLKAFYYQRCGMDLEEKYAGVWAHPACHTTKGTVYGQEGTELDGNGGWHDAGDYGKYTVAAATAVADLMMSWEFFPDSFGTKVNIPESGNRTPDILDEVRYEMEWLLKMQDSKTGGVYHKLTTKTFSPLSMMPQDDLGKLYFSPVSATATGSFAAVTAMASRVFSHYDAKFAKACLSASAIAWNWLEKNGSVPGFKNPGDMATGEYGDNNDADERFWAAAELYRTTGEQAYLDYVKKVYRNTGTGGFSLGWQNTGGFAGVALLHSDKSKQDSEIIGFLKSELLAAADKKLSDSRQSGYRITLGAGDFGWGSNMTLLNDARILILADGFDPAKGYRDAAKSNLNYLLGVNPLNQCYVTGFGSKPVMDPHHRPSKADTADQPVPGLVAGGPNSGLQDDFAKMKLKGKPPARCYVDYSGSYSTNEIAIYWNSPAVFVSACFSGKK